MRVDIQDATWVSLNLGLRLCGSFLLFTCLLLFWRPSSQLEGMDTAFLSQLILHERVDHTVACQLRLAFEG